MTPAALIGRTLPAALRAVRAARRRVANLARERAAADPWTLVALARAELAKAEPALARVLSAATLAGWVLAARRPTLDAIPRELTADVPPPPPPPTNLSASDESGRPIVLPLVEVGVRDLMQRQVVNQHEYNDLTAQAKAAAFTVARVLTADAVEAVRDAVAETVEKGKTLREFRREVGPALDGSGLSDAQVEAIFRTETARAMASGLITALNQPAVANEFPYYRFSHIHDARTRPEHVWLGTHGLDGTGIYRTDDPVGRKFFPPCGWSCRCVAIPYSVESAAEAGVREARAWLATGREPSPPARTVHPPFDLPKGWVPPNGSITTAI